MPRNGVSSAAPSRAPPRPAGRSRGSASRSPFAKPKGGTVSEPEEAASPRATSSRNGGRDHLGMVGDIKSERWARSFRNGGRHRAESASCGIVQRNCVAVRLLATSSSLQREWLVDCGRFSDEINEQAGSKSGGRCLRRKIIESSVAGGCLESFRT